MLLLIIYVYIVVNYYSYKHLFVFIQVYLLFLCTRSVCLYFFVSLSSNLDEDAKDVLNFGEIAYWSNGKAIVIGFGKTPLSYKDEIRLADKCNIWGDTEFDLRKLKSINSGELVGVKRC